MYPILFHLGFFSLRSYGLFMTLAFAAGIWLSLSLNRREGRSDEIVFDLAGWIMAGSVAGARLFYVLVMPDDFRAQPWQALFIWNGGLVYYGGLVGGTLTAMGWMRRHKLPVWTLADCLTPGLALGQAFGRLGCFFNGCCYGRVDAAHGLVFPSVGDGLPHLPVQLYEAGACLGLSLFLVWFKGRRTFKGQVFWVYVLAYAVIRFGLEFLRGDVERGVLVSPLLSPAQWISIAGAGISIYFMLRMKKGLRPQSKS